MVNRSAPLDRVFHALGDASRRSMVQQLVRGPASVSQLAEPLAMSLPAVVQHLGVLEGAGVVATEKVGRVRSCRLEPHALRDAEEWLVAQRTAWEHHLDRLGAELASPQDDQEASSHHEQQHHEQQRRSHA
jgi:DNA-binding transcriptional ArsR family regulator